MASRRGTARQMHCSTALKKHVLPRLTRPFAVERVRTSICDEWWKALYSGPGILGTPPVLPFVLACAAVGSLSRASPPRLPPPRPGSLARRPMAGCRCYIRPASPPLQVRRVSSTRPGPAASGTSYLLFFQSCPLPPSPPPRDQRRSSRQEAITLIAPGLARKAACVGGAAACVGGAAACTP